MSTPTSVCMPLTSQRTSSQMTALCRSGSMTFGSILADHIGFWGAAPRNELSIRCCRSLRSFGAHQFLSLSGPDYCCAGVHWSAPKKARGTLVHTVRHVGYTSAARKVSLACVVARIPYEGRDSCQLTERA
jgi:hypothetical protein